MNPQSINRAKSPSGRNNMEILFFLAVIVVWILLQVWVLPRLGVPT
jgi:hypothetical protein